MSNYKERFDHYLSDATSAVFNTVTDFNVLVPGLRPAAIRRQLTNISRLLGRLDRETPPFPEYLVDEDGSVPDLAINEIATIKNKTASGSESFIVNVVPRLQKVEASLERALGYRPKTIRDIKSQQARELQSIIGESQASLLQVRTTRQKLESEAAKTAIAGQQMQTMTKAVADSEAFITRTREAVERLANGDARGRDSLERLFRTARDKAALVEQAETKAKDASESCIKLNDEMESTLNEAESALKKLRDTQERADHILRGATQAGLAGAYKTERDRLAKEQIRYAFVFYGGVALILLYAIFFLLPIFNDIIQHERNANSQMGESALLLLVRLFVLSPVVWALLFTSRRFSRLETLQMDYAAKAATALAYNGYRDEMKDDLGLATKLRDGLLVRFLEHPERLLHKEVRESVDIGHDGSLKYSSSNDPSSSEVSN